MATKTTQPAASATVAPTNTSGQTPPAATAPVHASPAKKLETGKIGEIANNVLSQIPTGGSLVLAGVLDETILKETRYDPVTIFKGSFAVKLGEIIIESRKLVLPSNLREKFNAETAKLGKWEAVEFRAVIARGTDNSLGLSFTLAPREELSRALALLNS